jgi:hypothetical protein
MMPAERDLVAAERLAVLVELYRSLSEWAAAEAEMAGHLPVRTAREATARLDAAHTMCARYAAQIAALVKAWDSEDLRTGRVEWNM